MNVKKTKSSKKIVLKITMSMTLTLIVAQMAVSFPLINIMERPTCLPLHSIWHRLRYLNSASFGALFILFLCSFYCLHPIVDIAPPTLLDSFTNDSISHTPVFFVLHCYDWVG